LKGELTEGDILMVDFDKEANEIKVIDKKNENKKPEEEQKK
jgi:ATP-dependent Clp protease ATP-binding subunit ClpC